MPSHLPLTPTRSEFARPCCALEDNRGLENESAVNLSGMQKSLAPIGWMPLAKMRCIHMLEGFQGLWPL
jgi:hypothetical protein